MRTWTPWGCSLVGVLLGAALAAPGGAGSPGAKAEAILKRFAGEFLPITPGKGKFPASFVMGSGKDGPASEQPAHKVTLKRPFALARYEVTQELYQAITGENPSRWTGPRNSAEKVRWDEAVAFCRKVT